MEGTRFASSLSTSADSKTAIAETSRGIAAGLEGAPPDLLAVFVSHHHGEALDDLGQRIRAATKTRVLVGCTGESIVGGSREIERGPALSLWAGVLPGTVLRPFSVTASQAQGGAISFTSLPEVADRDRSSVLLFGDPFTFPMSEFLERLNADLPGVPAVGGMASGGSGPGQNLLFLGAEGRDEVQAEGAVGVAIEGDVEVRPVVSQGCRPIGKPYVITACQEHLVFKLGGRAATEVLMETLKDVSASDRALLQKRPFLGLAVDAKKSAFGRGDFLVRGIMGIDTRQGAILVADSAVRTGMTVQFLVRDAASADEDLTQLMRERKGDAQGRDPRSIGTLLFSCNGRGSRMFDSPNHDIGCVLSAFGESVPAAGFFAMGEIGPVGRQNFLHGFTASVAVFRERD